MVEPMKSTGLFTGSILEIRGSEMVFRFFSNVFADAIYWIPLWFPLASLLLGAFLALRTPQAEVLAGRNDFRGRIEKIAQSLKAPVDVSNDAGRMERVYEEIKDLEGALHYRFLVKTGNDQALVLIDRALSLSSEQRTGEMGEEVQLLRIQNSLDDLTATLVLPEEKESARGEALVILSLFLLVIIWGGLTVGPRLLL
jgi:hypothetical protein